MEHIARNVLASARAMVPGRFAARPADAATHPHIAWRDYDDARRRLEALGFRYLGDMEPTSLAYDRRTMRANVLRVLAGDGGTTVAEFYRIPLRWTLMGIMGRIYGGSGRFLDLVTLYQDGMVLTTSNVAAASVWTDPPFMRREFVPKGMPVEEMVARHRQRVREHAAAHPHLQPVAVRSLADVVAATDATERAKRAFRQSIGWITRDELARLGRLTGDQLDALEQAIRAVAAEEDA